MRVKMSKPPPPAPTASAIGPCPTVIKIVGRPCAGRLPSTIAPPDHLHLFCLSQGGTSILVLHGCSFIYSFVVLVGCFGFNGPLRQYFSLYRAVSQREGEREERIYESKNVQTTPAPTASAVGPCPTVIKIVGRPGTGSLVGWLFWA